MLSEVTYIESSCPVTGRWGWVIGWAGFSGKGDTPGTSVPPYPSQLCTCKVVSWKPQGSHLLNLSKFANSAWGGDMVGRWRISPSQLPPPFPDRKPQGWVETSHSY